MIDSSYNQKCYIMINSAPNNEEESLKIGICGFKNDIESINKDDVILNLKQCIIKFFNNQILEINIEFN